VRLHEFLQLILLLQLVTRRKTLLLLFHIKHHLLNSRPSLAVQVRQLRRFWVDLLSVDFGVALYGAAPPTRLVFPLLDIDVQILSFVVVQIASLDSPESLLCIDFVLPFTINQNNTIDGNSQLIKGNRNL
jgi:hypothetical protein